MNLFNVTTFTIGMLLLFNPCSFALLPSYLGLFLNLDSNSDTKDATGAPKTPLIVALNRAQIVSLTLAAGILTVLIPVGLVFQSLTVVLGDYIPWFNVALGLGLFGLGVAMLFGYKLSLNLPRYQNKSQAKTLTGVYLYGISYATAALGCSAPLIIAQLSATSSEGFGPRLGAVFSLALGLITALVTLTVAVSLGNQKLVSAFRVIMTKMNTITGVILVIAGIYLAWYGLWSVDLFFYKGDLGIPEGPIAWQQKFESSIGNFLEQKVNVFGGVSRVVLLGGIFIALNLTLMIMGFLKRNMDNNNPVADSNASLGS